MSDESNKIQHFSSANNSLFLCVLWKVLFDTEQLPDVAYKILERIGTKQLTAHLRSFCDLLVLEFSISGNFHYNSSICVPVYPTFQFCPNFFILSNLSEFCPILTVLTDFSILADFVNFFSICPIFCPLFSFVHLSIFIQLLILSNFVHFFNFSILSNLSLICPFRSFFQPFNFVHIFQCLSHSISSRDPK